MTLYPVCEGMPPTPSCAKADLNIGFSRTCIFVLGPFISALLISIVAHYCLDQKEGNESRAIKLRNAIAARRASARASARVLPLPYEASAAPVEEVGSTALVVAPAAVSGEADEPTDEPTTQLPPGEAETTAATRMQAAQRGRAARERPKKEAAAATRVQAIQRGKVARKSLQSTESDTVAALPSSTASS